MGSTTLIFEKEEERHVGILDDFIFKSVVGEDKRKFEDLAKVLLADAENAATDPNPVSIVEEADESDKTTLGEPEVDSAHIDDSNPAANTVPQPAEVIMESDTDLDNGSESAATSAPQIDKDSEPEIRVRERYLVH